MAPELVSIYPDKLSVPARAVISSAFLEPPALLHNNSAEEWAAVSPQGMLDAAGGNYRLRALLDNLCPKMAIPSIYLSVCFSSPHLAVMATLMGSR